jgi:hypothetical protein
MHGRMVLPILSCDAPPIGTSTGTIRYVIPVSNAAACAPPSGAMATTSIAAALAPSMPGDEVRLLPGVFDEVVVFARGGTSGNPITSYPYLIVDGLEVRNCQNNGIKVDGDANGTPTPHPAGAAHGYYSYGYYAGWYDDHGNIRNYNVNGSDYVVIRNNRVHHTGDDGLKIGHTNHIYMLNNEIYRAGTAAEQQGIDMVGVYDSVVCGNYIHDEPGLGGPQSMNKGIFDKGGSQNILIQNNVVRDIEPPEACIEVGGDTEWYNTRYDPHLVDGRSSTDIITNINSQILDQTMDPRGSGHTIGLLYLMYQPHYAPELMSESRFAVVRGNLMVNCDPPLSMRNTYGARVYNNTAIDSGASQHWLKLWDDNEADGDGTLVHNGITWQEANHDNVDLQVCNNLFSTPGWPWASAAPSSATATAPPSARASC